MTGKIIQGRVLTEDGFPMAGAVIKEIPLQGNIGANDVWADGTGAFYMQVLNQNSTIQVSAEGFGTLYFPATSVPSEIRMVIEEIIIEVNRNKTDNSWKWIAGGIAAVAILAMASGNKPTKATTPAPKKLSKPKTYTV